MRRPAASRQRVGKTWTNSKGEKWKVALKVVKGRAKKKKYWKKLTSCKCKCKCYTGCICKNRCRCYTGCKCKCTCACRTKCTPSVRARSLPVGSKRKGRDGKRYVVVKRSNGKRWKKISSSKRKSPTVSASIYVVGTKKRGNDGNLWIIKTSTRNGKRYRVWRRSFIRR